MIEFIRDQLPKTELLAQLAEEAAELAQAALKIRRVIDGRNPTPVKLSEAEDNLVEEIADVKLCLRVLGYDLTDPKYDWAGDRKLDRWARRMKQVKGAAEEEKTESGLLEE